MTLNAPSRRWLPVLLGTMAGLLAGVIIARCAQNRTSKKTGGHLEYGEDEESSIPEIVGFKQADVPENAPHGCPGVESELAGHGSACEGCPNRTLCASGQAADTSQDDVKIADTLQDVKHKILVLSGKGGVGKSTVATQLAFALEAQGFSVGLLDVDICGPSVPHLTGTSKELVKPYGEGWLPVSVTPNLLVISVAYMLPEEDGAVIWRGPKKNGLIKQFLTDVYWGTLDYLIIDTPPGTSDEHLSIITYLRKAKIDGALVVTTPQETSLLDVRKELSFCKTTSIPVLGVIENMSSSVFSSVDPDGTVKTCAKMGVPYAGTISLDQAIVEAAESGKRVPPDSEAGQQFLRVMEKCLANIPPRT